MPQKFDGFSRKSDHGLTATTRTLPGDDRRAFEGLAGEIDIASTPGLSKTVDWLTAQAPVSVLVDLAKLTFACSTLPNFIAQVRHAVPDGAKLCSLAGQTHDPMGTAGYGHGNHRHPPRRPRRTSRRARLTPCLASAK